MPPGQFGNFARRVIAPARSWAKMSPEELERMIARTAKSELESKMLGVVRATPPADRTMRSRPQRALEALLLPDSQESLAAVGDMVSSEGLQVGDVLGSGTESIVFGLKPRLGPDSHVLKLSVDTNRAHGLPMQLAEDTDGVAPYWLTENFGPLWMGVQERADYVMPTYPKPRDVMEGWNRMADRLAASLDSRGYYWDDSIPHNMGIMPGGSLAVIDGSVRKLLPAELDGLMGLDVPSAAAGMYRAADGTLQQKPPKMTPEEAIRALILTPADKDLIRRTERAAP